MYLLFKCKKCEHNLYIPMEEAIDTMSSLSDCDCPNCGEEGYENWIFVETREDLPEFLK